MRAVSISARRRSSQPVPRIDVATREPMAVSAIATTASATSTSMSVKPAWGSLRPRLRPRAARSEEAERDNLDPSRQPVDADLVTDAEPGTTHPNAPPQALRQKPD